MLELVLTNIISSYYDSNLIIGNNKGLRRGKFCVVNEWDREKSEWLNKLFILFISNIINLLQKFFIFPI